VFTARYALSPYIKQIRFVFKWLYTFASSKLNSLTPLLILHSTFRLNLSICLFQQGSLTKYWCMTKISDYYRQFENFQVWIFDSPCILWNQEVFYRLHKNTPLVLSQLNPVHSLHPTSWRSILILSSHLRLGLPSGRLPSGLPTKTVNEAQRLKRTETENHV
jgi:hypothetical protein